MSQMSTVDSRGPQNQATSLSATWTVNLPLKTVHVAHYLQDVLQAHPYQSEIPGPLGDSLGKDSDEIESTPLQEET